MRISVLGLGRMGAPIARNLLEVGHEVTVYSRNRERLEQFTAGGFRAGATVADAVRDAQVALTMVPGDEAEEAVTFGAGGLLSHLRPEAIHLCMSTISVEMSRKLASAHEKAGQKYVAAPVIGRPGMVASRQLWVIVGGLDAPVKRCQAVFDALGKGVTRVGAQPELAHALKLGGDLLAAVMVEGLSEVLTFGEKAGMAPGEYLRLLNMAIFKSPMVDAAGGLMIRRRYDQTDLPLDASLRGLQAVTQAAEGMKTTMPLAELLQARLELASAQGWGGQDLTALCRTCRMDAGLESGGNTETVGDSPATFQAWSPAGPKMLELRKVTHFEVINNAIWAWTEGNRYRTAWKHLAEVERSFRQVAFLRIHRHILLQPEAAKAKQKKRDAEDPLEQDKPEPSAPELAGPPSSYPARLEEDQVTLDLAKTTHFELEADIVWAWHQGRRHRTFWKTLSEVETSFRHVPMSRIQPNILLNPGTVLSFKPLFGGRIKVTVLGDQELRVTREATARLKALLGI